MHHRQRLLAAAITAAATLAPAAAQAAPVETQFKRQADPLAAPQLGKGWHGFKADHLLSDRRVRVLDGEVGPDGCRFDVTSKLTTEEVAEVARSRAVNVGTCQMLLESGVPPAAVIAREDAAAPESPDCGQGAADDVEGTPGSENVPTPPNADEVPTDPGDMGTPVPGVGASVDPPASGPTGRCGTMRATAPYYPRSAGFFKSRFEDPAFLDVTSVTNTIDYTYGGGCVQRAAWGDSVYWLDTSGWALTRRDLAGYRTCAQTSSSTRATMRNRGFCRLLIGLLFGRTTYNTYDRNIITGKNTGTLYSRVGVAYASGGCANLLTFYSYSRRTA